MRVMLQVFNYTTPQFEYNHNHICYIYHYILDIVSVISHIRGHRKLLFQSNRDSNQFLTETELS